MKLFSIPCKACNKVDAIIARSRAIFFSIYSQHVEKDIPAAREVFRRVCRVHLCEKPTVHWHWAMFEERHPAQLDNIDNNQQQPSMQPITCLEILTQLEERLPDSALVCSRRIDAMRRARKPVIKFFLFDLE